MTITIKVPPEIVRRQLEEMMQKGEMPPEILEKCYSLLRPKWVRILYPLLSVFFLGSSLIGLYLGNTAMAIGSLGPMSSALYLTIIEIK